MNVKLALDIAHLRYMERSLCVVFGKGCSRIAHDMATATYEKLKIKYYNPYCHKGYFL